MHGKVQGTTYVKFEDKKNKLLIGGSSWTINLDELPKGIKTVEYWCGDNVYTISLKDALGNGFERLLGGEHKLIVPVKNWEYRDEVIKTGKE